MDLLELGFPKKTVKDGVVRLESYRCNVCHPFSCELTFPTTVAPNEIHPKDWNCPVNPNKIAEWRRIRGC